MTTNRQDLSIRAVLWNNYATAFAEANAKKGTNEHDALVRIEMEHWFRWNEWLKDNFPGTWLIQEPEFQRYHSLQARAAKMEIAGLDAEAAEVAAALSLDQ